MWSFSKMQVWSHPGAKVNKFIQRWLQNRLLKLHVFSSIMPFLTFKKPWSLPTSHTNLQPGSLGGRRWIWKQHGAISLWWFRSCRLWTCPWPYDNLKFNEGCFLLLTCLLLLLFLVLVVCFFVVVAAVAAVVVAAENRVGEREISCEAGATPEPSVRQLPDIWLQKNPEEGDLNLMCFSPCIWQITISSMCWTYTIILYHSSIYRLIIDIKDTFWFRIGLYHNIIWWNETNLELQKAGRNRPWSGSGPKNIQKILSDRPKTRVTWAPPKWWWKVKSNPPTKIREIQRLVKHVFPIWLDRIDQSIQLRSLTFLTSSASWIRVKILEPFLKLPWHLLLETFPKGKSCSNPQFSGVLC